MGNCSTKKLPTVISSQASILKTQYDHILKQIKATRLVLIKQYIKDNEDQRLMEEDFSFSQDIQLVKEYNMSDWNIKFNKNIRKLQEIEQKFQALERIKNELDRRVVQSIKEKSQKTKTILDQVSHLRQQIYDYFYSDLEVTDVPNELI